MRTPTDIETAIARRLAALRADRKWSLEQLAAKTGLSRPTLSRIERGELSPTAAMLNTLCAQYGWTVSRLMSEAETGSPTVVRFAEQLSRTDPESGYVRRVVSPPHPRLKGELVEVTLPSGASVAYDRAPVIGLEHHLWMLAGSLELEVDGASFRLEKGDCMRYVLCGGSRFRCAGKRAARYALVMVQPW